MRCITLEDTFDLVCCVKCRVVFGNMFCVFMWLNLCFWLCIVSGHGSDMVAWSH